jgi:hypothetical protein
MDISDHYSKIILKFDHRPTPSLALESLLEIRLRTYSVIPTGFNLVQHHAKRPGISKPERSCVTLMRVRCSPALRISALVPVIGDRRHPISIYYHWF